MIEPVPAGLEGERLDRVVSMMSGVSRAEASSLVAAGHVRVNDEVVLAKAHRLVEGDEVGIDRQLAPDAPGLTPDPSVRVTVIHEDADLFVVDKQAGLVVHPGAGNPEGTLVQGMLALDPALAGVGGGPARPGIVHRLDKDTSGLMVVARSQQAYEAMVAALAAREVERTYQALAWGAFETTNGLIDAPIGRSTREPTRMAVSSQGKEARTRYRVMQAFDDPGVTLLECQLETGRTHQIRVHLAAIGHPVVGDDRYRGVRPSLQTPRIFLHAARLAFVHPITGAPMSFEAELPEDLTQVLAGLTP